MSAPIDAAPVSALAPANDPTFDNVWDELVYRGLIHVSTDENELRELLSGDPIVYYCGFDPTAPSLHLGNLVQLLLMRRLQLAGHRPLGLVGGSTGLVGDPRPTAERTLNTRETVAEWVNQLRGQVERFLSFEGENAARIVNNLDWTAPLSAIDFLREIGKHFRVGTMLKKDAVSARLTSEAGISYTEFSYQILQGLDYLELHRSYGCVLQTGGSDQWGNLTSGTDLVRKVEGVSVHAIGTPLITNSDGTKFGKSEGNAIWLDAEMRSELTPADVVIIPAFGTTLETQQQLTAIGLDVAKYDTTCPFVEKVWNKAGQIGQKDYTIVVHGKPSHEETRATFSHSKENGPTVVVKDMAQTRRLAMYITGELPADQFYTEFADQYSVGFDPERDLQRIGVVNQTTMLASDTQGIADYLKQVMIDKYQLEPDQADARFANTRDTLCYATNDNQDATYALLTCQADFAIVAGGYNSSNTSHIVELCEEKFTTYFIESEKKILSDTLIRHYDSHQKEEVVTEQFLPAARPVSVLLTCGASCPDAVVEGIMLKLVSYFPDALPVDQVMAPFSA